MNKAVILSVLLFLLTSLFVVAQEESAQDSCSGFWGSIKCFFWGNPENRVGRGWFEGRSVVGEAAAEINSYIAGVHVLCDVTSGCIYEINTNVKDFDQLDLNQQIAVASLVESHDYEPQTGEYVTPAPSPPPAPSAPTAAPSPRSPPVTATTPAPSTPAPAPAAAPAPAPATSAPSTPLPAAPTPPVAPATTATPAPAPPPPPNTPIPGTPYFLTPEGNFVDADGNDALPMDQLLNPRRPIITHDQAYAMFNARAQQLETKVLQANTPVIYQGSTYNYNDQKKEWKTTDGEVIDSTVLTQAVIEGQAQPNILSGLSSSTFKVGTQQYTYANNAWHTGDANGAVISAADLQTKLLDPKAKITENNELSSRIAALRTQREAAKKARQQADSQLWAGSWFEFIQTSEGYQSVKKYSTVAGDIASVMASGGRYQALSNALFGTETSRNWLINADSEMFTTLANLPSYAATHGPLAPEACQLDDARRTDIPGSSSQFVQTVSGSYQFVGSIQAEKTSTLQPILCIRNEDPTIESEFICRRGQVCVDGSFCHLDADNDGEPDSDAPAQGYFYKIVWGVAAPADESFTPYIDEDNKAVKFNIQLIATDGSIWLYTRGGITGTSVIALENGARDRDVITHFSSRLFTKACIMYDPRYIIKDRYGDEIDEEQCVDIINRDSGVIEFGASQRTESVTTTSAEVSSNTDW